MQARRFGISTRLFADSRLGREPLLAVGAHGFETVELLASRSHFDYHNPAAVADLQQWLAESGLLLHSVHAPLGDRTSAGQHHHRLSLADSDNDARAHAVAEATAALQIARRIPFAVFVAHLGVPRSATEALAQNSRDAARRSV